MIYLDNAATTPLLSCPALEDAPFFANPSSPHTLGIIAERAITQSRQVLGDILLCKPAELIFTSGGTEANNLAILGFAFAHMKTHPRPTLFAEPWAHPSVLAPIQFAAEQGFAQAVIAPAKEWNIPGGAALCCLSHVHHETGDITPIADIARETKKINCNAVIFTDGAQGFCKDIHAAQVYTASDLYSFSGHKCHAPTGTGGLMVRVGVKISPLLHGGGHENGLRSGTENTAGIVHMAHCARYLHENATLHHERLYYAYNTVANLAGDLPDVFFNRMGSNVSPYILNLSFLGTKGEVLVHMLAEKGIMVSMGAACKSRKKDKSALAAMGKSREFTESALRISFSHLNTQDETEYAKEILRTAVMQLRKISRYI
ncbi:MAG: aminotransferase class V-fold PLP-dependent enzyme [Defluviitaleaceae bacterium]|nr:aminotransferase class V-fold PLP-dependent enzyme [Defluviitaleaceae bacterium]MCL2273322.1 aminotransferase class V-fold PLP-dependent enzyme [Defluviitaleaceae bacterium]